MHNSSFSALKSTFSGSQNGIGKLILYLGLAMLAAGCTPGKPDLQISQADCVSQAENPANLQPCAGNPAPLPTPPDEKPEFLAQVRDATPAEIGPLQATARTDLTLPPSMREPEATASIGSIKAEEPGRQTNERNGGGSEKTIKNSKANAKSASVAVAKLADAVASAVLTYPEIWVNKARVREAKAGIGIAESALYPSVDIKVAGGGSFAGSYEGHSIPFKTSSSSSDLRFDGGFVLRQLIYDFGAAQADIDRARFLRDAEKLKLQEKIEDIAYKTAQIYLKILEQRALLQLADETTRSHEELARIVQAHSNEGHGTIADVQRVNSRLVDVRSIRADISLQLMAAEDQFERYTHRRAGRLQPVENLLKAIPATSTGAIARLMARNPRLAALEASRLSIQKELEYQEASGLPKFGIELDTESRNFRKGSLGRMQPEARAMVAMRYRLLDGGLNAATKEQISARIDGAASSLLNEREQFESDIRQAYRAIDSAARKYRLVSEGVESARKVRELYLEQFKGGKRTVFELLDGQMSYYTSRRSQIENQYEGQRATFDILRATSDLTNVLARGS